MESMYSMDYEPISIPIGQKRGRPEYLHESNRRKNIRTPIKRSVKSSKKKTRYKGIGSVKFDKHTKSVVLQPTKSTMSGRYPAIYDLATKLAGIIDNNNRKVYSGQSMSYESTRSRRRRSANVIGYRGKRKSKVNANKRQNIKNILLGNYGKKKVSTRNKDVYGRFGLL